MSEELRAFNDKGNREYRGQFILVADKLRPTVQESLLLHPELSAPLGTGISIEQRTFASRWDLGTWLAEVLRDLPDDKLSTNTGLWNWITARYFDQLYPGPRGGSGMERYVLDLNNYQHWHRHLVRTPWALVRSHGEHARVVLTARVNEMADEVEQLVSRQDFLAGRSILEVAGQLYLRRDEDTLRLARKAKDKKDTPGSLRRYITLVQQLWCTWDLIGMPAERLLELLPPEFNRWLEEGRQQS